MHTLGPWHVELLDDDGEGAPVWCVCHPKTQCDVTTVCNTCVEDDARLIAAAPEMLEALKQAAAEMQAGFGSSFGETREQVRRAIAKATQNGSK